MDRFSNLIITAIGWSFAKLRGATSTDSIPYWFAKTTSVNTLSPARGIVAINDGQCETKDWMVDSRMIDVERIENYRREASQQYKIFDTIHLLLLFPMVLS
jgi:hypothetical protein